MKTINKKYIFGISILACLIFGGLLTKPLIIALFTSSNQTVPPVVAQSSSSANTTSYLALDNTYMARDILTYTNEANAIVVGEVREVGNTYLKKDRGFSSQQDVKIDIKEVLKGDSNMTQIKVLLEGEQTVIQAENGEISFRSEQGGTNFNSGEKILLFLGKTNWGDYVSFAGPYGKYLIDENNNVSSIGDFKMSLENLKAKIREDLKIPARK